MDVEIAQYEALGKELLRRCFAEEEPMDLHRWLSEQLARLGGGDTSAVLSWPDSIALTERIIDEYERLAGIPESQRLSLRWPWESWNKLIDPLEEGMLGVITAPDGVGKTIYAESLAEYWAQRKNKVVFVHYELNRKLMMLRRVARWTGLSVRKLKAGQLNPLERKHVAELQPRFLAWDGYITYLHTPGWSMERTVAELRRLHAEGQCDVVVLDYLEKAMPSTRQLKMFGTNLYQREADNVEQLKNFAEVTELPAIMIAQMNKEAKGKGIEKTDRTGMRGAGEKSEKANLVVLLQRERLQDGYSNTVDVYVDKNTMGATGGFQQIMQPEYFRVGDIYSDELLSTNGTQQKRIAHNLGLLP